jgi:hypothetical protein
MQCGNGSRLDPAACGEVQRVGANAFDRGQAESIDRRLGDGKPADPLPCPAEPEQCFRPAVQRAFVVRAADLDVSDGAITAAMGEPGAAERTIPRDADFDRSRQDRSRNTALLGQVGQARDPGRSLDRCFQRLAIGRSGRFERDGRNASGNVGATPISRLSSLRTCPKFKLGSRCCTRSNTVLPAGVSAPRSDAGDAAIRFEGDVGCVTKGAAIMCISSSAWGPARVGRW